MGNKVRAWSQCMTCNKEFFEEERFDDWPRNEKYVDKDSVQRSRCYIVLKCESCKNKEKEKLETKNNVSKIATAM